MDEDLDDRFLKSTDEFPVLILERTLNALASDAGKDFAAAKRAWDHLNGLVFIFQAFRNADQTLRYSYSSGLEDSVSASPLAAVLATMEGEKE